MDFVSLAVFVLVFVLCYIYLKRSKNSLPGPTPIPFIGRPSFFHSATKRRYEMMIDAAKTYGDIYCVKQGPYNFVFVHGYDNIHELFVKRSDEFSNRPTFIPNLRKALSDGTGVIWESGHLWKVLRRFTLQTLRDFGVGKTSIEEKIFEEIDAASKEFETLKGHPTDVRLLTTMMISNVIYGIVFGRRFSYDDTFFHDLLHKLDSMFKGQGLLSTPNFLPRFIAKMIASKKDIENTDERLAALAAIKAHIYAEIKQHEETFDSGCVRDFVDLYVDAERSDKDPSKQKFDVSNIFRTIVDLFLAGSETTSNTINWCILYLMERPDVQKRCYQELQLTFGDRPVRWSDHGKCPYVEATLLEIQRLSNIAPFSLPHSNPADAQVNGYTIPKNSILVANLYSAHMDQKYWVEPEVFKPERFIDDNGKIKKTHALIPFSLGPRMCLGESLARMEMFLIFTNLVQRFEFRRDSQDKPHDFQPIFDQTTNAPRPYKVCAIKRV